MIEAPVDVFNASEIKSRLEASSLIPERCFIREETDSTNTWAKRLAEEGSPSGTLAVAERRTQEKGPKGKVWSSPEAHQYMTLLLRPEILPQYAAPLALVMGLSVAQALSETLGLPAGIKWPNDVVVSGKKDLRYFNRDECTDRLCGISGDRNGNQCQHSGISR